MNEIKAGRRWKCGSGHEILFREQGGELCFGWDLGSGFKDSFIRSSGYAADWPRSHWVRLPDDPTQPGWKAEPGAMLQTEVDGVITLIERENNYSWNVEGEDGVKGRFLHDAIERMVWKKTQNEGDSAEEVAPGFFVGDRVLVTEKNDAWPEFAGKLGTLVSYEEYEKGGGDVWGLLNELFVKLDEETYGATYSSCGPSFLSNLTRGNYLSLGTAQKRDTVFVGVGNQEIADDIVDSIKQQQDDDGAECRDNDEAQRALERFCDNRGLSMASFFTVQCLVCDQRVHPDGIAHHRAQGGCFLDHEPVDLEEQYKRQLYLIAQEEEQLEIGAYDGFEEQDLWEE